MKYFFTSVLIVFSFTISISQTFDFPNQKQASLDWIIGDWGRTNDDKGMQSFEKWAKISASEYNGFGFTLQNADTVFKEHMKLIKVNDVWNFVAIGVNPEPTYFQFTDQTRKSFICENLENDFPKRIAYSVKKDKLVAKISDDNNQILFYYKKKKNKF